MLPVNLKSIDRARVTWPASTSSLAMGEARPLYFFDSDGTRAGTLWYIRRVAVDRVNTEVAEPREAEDLGLYNPDYWSAARSYLERLDNPRPRPLDATGPLSAADPQKRPEPAPTRPHNGASRQQYAHARTRGAGQLVEGIFPSSAALSLPETASRPASQPKASGGYGSRPRPLANTYGAHGACSRVVSRPFHDSPPRRLLIPPLGARSRPS